MDYNGDREVEGFKKWLAENSEAYKKHSERNSLTIKLP
jgi:hypothetical protein